MNPTQTHDLIAEIRLNSLILGNNKSQKRNTGALFSISPPQSICKGLSSPPMLHVKVTKLLSTADLVFNIFTWCQQNKPKTLYSFLSTFQPVVWLRFIFTEHKLSMAAYVTGAKTNPKLFCTVSLGCVC